MSICDRCGTTDHRHTWVEGDCVLPHRGHHKATIGHACTGCVQRHRDWLREIIELFTTLAQVVPAGSVPDDTADHGKPRKQPASPAPMRLDAWAMLHDRQRLYRTGRDSDLPDVPAVLDDLAQRILDDHPHGGDEAGASLDGTAVTAARILTEWGERIARGPWIDEYDAELAWVRRRLRAAHGLASKHPVGRCPSLDGNGDTCDGPLWPDRHGRLAVDCARCRRHYDETYLRHLGAMIGLRHADA